MQTINPINWSSQYLTKYQLLWTESTEILHAYINSKLKKRKKFHPPTLFEVQFNQQASQSLFNCMMRPFNLTIYLQMVGTYKKYFST